MSAQTYREHLDTEIRVWDFAPSDRLRESPTPRVYLQGQLHANETTSSLVLHRLIDRSDCPVFLRVVPMANPLGWTTYAETGEGRLSNPGGLDWNRLFEGVPASFTESAATPENYLRDRLWQLSRGFDVIIDVHTPEFGWPHVYASSVERTLRTFVDLPHVIYGDPVAPTFDEAHLRAAGHSGRPEIAVTLELPSHEVITERVVEAWALRIHEELVAQAAPKDGGSTPARSGTMVNLETDFSGVTYAIAPPATACSQGDPVLGVVAMDGTSAVLRAPGDCVPLCYRRRTLVKAGTWAVRVLAFA